MIKAIADSNFQKALDHFDFKVIHEVMELMNWKWATKKGYKVPSQAEMIESVIRLYSTMDFVGRTSSGGFEIEIEEDNVVSIRFVAYESMWMQEFDQTDGMVVENE